MPQTIPSETTHDPKSHPATTQSQHQSQTVASKPKYDPESNPAYQAFKKAADTFSASLDQLGAAIKAFKPSADPLDVDKTRGLSDIANTMLGMTGQLNELTRFLTGGPGGGVGGHAGGYDKTTPDKSPAPSDPGYDQPAHSSQSGQPPAAKSQR